jgi:hypothetical protein
MPMRRCRYRPCGEIFTPLKPNYYFCCWEHRQAHYESNDYRGYQRSSDQSYDRGYWDGTRGKPSAGPAMPPHIWKALAVLVHPDRWQREPGLLSLSHEAMVWLNTHRPADPERN